MGVSGPSLLIESTDSMIAINFLGIASSNLLQGCQVHIIVSEILLAMYIKHINKFEDIHVARFRHHLTLPYTLWRFVLEGYFLDNIFLILQFKHY